jgi:MFS transporter, AAHS family, 4-hydroxybenzoate transporter
MNLHDGVNTRSAGAVELRVAALCGVTMFMAGFDAQEIGYVVPAIGDAWGIDSTAFAPVFAAGLMGIMMGALIGGPAADRIGRRPVLIASALWFGIGSLLTISAGSIDELLVFRLFTGIGIGSAMPNAIALTTEYVPGRRRSTVSMLMFCGFSLGAAAAGVAAATLTGSSGWTTVFLIGGAVPCAVIVLLWFGLPESIQYVHTRQRVSEAPAFPVTQLFAAGRASLTLLIWVVFFTNLLVLHFVTAWLPTIVRDAGVPLDRAVLITATFQTGAVAAAFPLGRLLDATAPFRTLGLVYLTAGVCVVLIGAVGTSVPLLFAMAFAAGVCILGGQLGANAISAFVYPTSARATGVGWALGVGRIGSIVGPVIGGWLLSLEWEPQSLFAVAALPAAIAGATAFALHRLWPGVHPPARN